jgi:hypothetical protein
MNVYKQIWLEEVGLYATGVLARSDPHLQNTHVAEQNTLKKMVGSGSLRTSQVIALGAAVAWADGPLPIGDVIAATGLAAFGAYMLLS